MKTMTIPSWLVVLVLAALALLTTAVLILFLRPGAPKPGVVLKPGPAQVGNQSSNPPSALFTEAELRLAQTMGSNPAQKVLSGTAGSVNYTQELAKAEVIVGHAFRFQRVSHSAVFLLRGPGTYEFAVNSGAWYKHTNTTPSLNEALLQGQIDIMVKKYHVPLESVKIHRPDAVGSSSER